MGRRLIALILALALVGGCTDSSDSGGGGATTGGSTGSSGSSGGTTTAAATVAVSTPSSPASGVVDVPFQVTGGPQALTVEYSVDSGRSWFPARAAPGSASLGSVGSGSHTFRWASTADLGATIQDDVRIRVSPANGQAGETSDFEVDDSGAQAAARILRYPYLQKATRTSILVAWETDRDVVGSVAYGRTPALGQVATGHSTDEHAIEITGLQPGTEYYYRIRANGNAIAPGHRFRTNAAPGQAFDFVMFGDCGTGNAIQRDLAERMEEIDPDFGIIAGDVVYEYGAWWEFDSNYFGPYRDLLQDRVFYTALGNHDIITLLGQPYLENFHLPTNNPSGSERYYSFDYGDARFIALDSSTSVIIPGTDQHRWLIDQLTDPNRPTWTFVYMHHPPYSSGVHGSDRPLRWVVSPLFENEEVDVVFTGHDHHYERTTRVADYAPQNGGLVYFVVGSAGKPSRSFGSSSFTATSSGENVILHCTLQGRTLSTEAVRADGTVIDSWSMTKP